MPEVGIGTVIFKATYTKVISEAFSAVKKVLKPTKIQILVTKENLVQAINSHYTEVQNLTKSIDFKDLRGSKNLNEQYIGLDIELQPRRWRSKDEEPIKTRIDDLVSVVDRHLVLLGGPGAGKTTTVRKICQNLFSPEPVYPYNFPILINLRDLSEPESIYGRLKNILGLQIFVKSGQDTIPSEEIALRERCINEYLNSLKSIVILDGLDEVNPYRLDSFHREIKTLMTGISNSLIIVTCRSASYNVKIPNSTEYELCDLTPHQIEEFTGKWFIDDKAKAYSFLNELKGSKFTDLSLKPITLAHLCAIYERTNKFYDKPRSVYDKLISLLIEEWDEQRGISRDSKYASFDSDMKKAFLRHFSYILSITYSNKVYPEENFMVAYEKVHETFGLPASECNKVVKEIEEHTGIIIKSSFETYEFVHKSMQEYLTAQYMVNLSKIPVKLIYDINISNELAIAVSLSSDANSYYYDLVFDYFNREKLKKQFVQEFLDRLSYESPNFRPSLLIPYSLVYLFDLLIKNRETYENGDLDGEFEVGFAFVMKALKRDINIRKSFIKFRDFIEVIPNPYGNLYNSNRLRFIRISPGFNDELNDEEDYNFSKEVLIISEGLLVDLHMK